MLCLFFTNVAFLQIPAYVALAIIAIWGLYITIRNIVKYKAYKKMEFGIWAAAFLAMNFITALVHITDNFLINMLFILFMCICFFVFYGAHTEPDTNIKHEIYELARIFLYMITLMQVVGIFCLFMDISYRNEWIKLIIYENRYTGLFINPNLSGFSSVVVVFSVHILSIHNFDSKTSEMSKISRIWLASGLFISIITLFLSDSNASLVLFLGYVIVFVICKFLSSRERFNRKQFVLKFISTVLAGIVIIFCTFFMRTICQIGVAAIINNANQISVGDSDSILPPTENDEVTFEHENENVDSGRLTLWSQALTIYSHYPVEGIGKGNILLYSYDYFEEGMHFSNLYSGDFASLFAVFTTDIHNAYLTILLCSGVIGFLLFMAFAFRNGFYMTRFLYNAKDKLQNDIFPCMFSFVVAYLGFALFEKAILYDISFMVIIFWMILGQMACYNIREKEEHNLKDDNNIKFKESIKKTLL
ncbi:MAG: O-antigen ligase family protein [Oscillospiraceae bacterium]|nr:O-antigen ligase family protein [Oscillospiraceae bacterium]